MPRHTIYSIFFMLIPCFSTFLPESNGLNPGKTYKGYVITTEGDTLRGSLEMLSPTQNQLKIKYINRTEMRFFKAKELQAYAFEVPLLPSKTDTLTSPEWVFYVKKIVDRPPVPFASNEVLLQQIVGGNVSLYNYYVEARSEQEVEHLLYIEKNGALQVIDKENYRKILKTLMADKPEALEIIGTKGYAFKQLPKIIAHYNGL